MYKVSIIVPFYNVEEYIEKCLFRLARQTMKDIEIILVNDGSLDGSHIIAEKYVNMYPDLFKLYVKENGGLSDARNYGIERAQGEYLGFIDSDDYPECEMYELLYNKANETDADIVVCNFNKFIYDYNTEGGEKVIPVNIENKDTDFGKSIWEEKGNLRFASPYAWNKLYRRKLFGDIRYPKGQVFEDSATTYKLFSLANKIEFVNEYLYNYRLRRAGAITSTVSNKIFDVLKSCESNTVYFKEKGCFDHFHDELEYLCIMHIYARINSLKGKSKASLKIKFVRKAFKFLDANYPNWKKSAYYTRTRVYQYTADKLGLYNKIRDSKFLLILYLLMYNTAKNTSKFMKKVKKYFFQLKNIRTDGDIKSKATISRQLTETQLRILQLEELKILKIIDEFCENNNLRYYLAEGTLLGAVRHNGFIPWDDDVDIAMPREDYNKLLKLWSDGTVDNCVLLHQSTFNKYYLPFAKIVLQGDNRFKSKRMVPDKFHGPNVDIFPLDDAEEVYNIKQLKNCKKIRRYRNIMLVKAKYMKSTKAKLKYGLKAKLFSFLYLQRKIEKLCTKFSKKEVNNIANYCSSYLIDKECMPKECYKEPIKIQFEDAMLNIPNDSEKVLKTIYGDFMKLPPENKRVCRHAFYWCGGEGDEQ